jgi:hypothetical protein
MNRLEILLLHQARDWKELLNDLARHERRVVQLLHKVRNLEVDFLSCAVCARQLESAQGHSALYAEPRQGLDQELDNLRQSREKFETLSLQSEITGQLLLGEGSPLHDTDRYHPANIRVEYVDWLDHIEDVIQMGERPIADEDIEVSQNPESEPCSSNLHNNSDYTIPITSKPIPALLSLPS